MIEEYVNKLAELQAERKANENEANEDEAMILRRTEVANASRALEVAKAALSNEMIFYEATLERLDAEIAEVKQQIIDEWTGDRKTMIFDAGTLKFRQTGSLKIHDELYLFKELYDYIWVDELINKYLNGFNLAAVKKFMGVHPLPSSVAEIEYKTTVKLELDEKSAAREAAKEDD